LSRDLKHHFQDEDFLLFCLPTAARRTAHICVMGYASNFDMGVPEWRLVALIGRFEGVSAKEGSDLMDQGASSRARPQMRASRLHPRNGESTPLAPQAAFVHRRGVRSFPALFPPRLSTSSDMEASRNQWSAV